MAKRERAPGPAKTADIRAGLRAAGIRSTSARVAVLQVLHRLRSPVSHAELAAHDELAGFDRATVYRNLIDLADAGGQRLGSEAFKERVKELYQSHHTESATNLGAKLTEILDSLEGSQMAQDDRTFLLARRT